MRIKTTVYINVLIALGVAAAGCQSQGPAVKTPSQQAMAQKQWSDARAAVLGGLAMDQYKNGSFDKCQTTLDEALRLSPDNEALHILAAKLAIEQGKLELAEAQLDQAKKLDPKDAEADYLTGVVLQRWRQPQQAYEAYASAAHKNPRELAYVMAESEMMVSLNRATDAIELLKTKVAYFEHSAAIRDALGQLLVEQGRYVEGASMLREASILATDDSTIREHLAFAMFYAKQYHLSAGVFTRLLKDDSYAKRADIYGALGECQSQDGQVDDARRSMQTATQLDPSCTGYWLGLGRVDAQANDLPGADLAVRRALSMEPNNSEAHCLQGYIRLRQDQLPQALAAFHMANRMDATDTVSLCMQGYVLEKMGRSSEARQFFTRALQIKPNDELATRLMAAVEP